MSISAEDLVSGPPVGTAVSSIPCYANSGNYAGRESFNVAEEIGSRPGMLLFVHVLNRNTAPVIRAVDNLAREFGVFGFKSFVVTLSDDRTAAEEQLRRVNRSLKLNEPMVLSLDGLDGPGSLALNRRCTLSLIGLRDGAVIDSIGFTDTGLHDVERIRGLAEKVIGEVPEGRSELMVLAASNLPSDNETLRKLAARQAVELYQFYQAETEEHANSRRYNGRRQGMQRGKMNARGAAGARQRPGTSVKKANEGEKKVEQPSAVVAPKRERRGGPPGDSVLNSLLRSYIRKTNDNSRIDEIYGDILNRSTESDDLQKQSIAMFQLMLSFPDRYGTDHAQKLAKEFLKQHNAE
ncbi:hypothetical protein N8766_03040 [bacterium]|jgi:hypothetical protein|nr:hypothetical protein [Verrucomicrobiota bacterium]MDA7633062.1 hypothetical protein [bacterium]MDA7866565.1 hypothetical protein [Verrucomicrobiota bacterium]